MEKTYRYGTAEDLKSLIEPSQPVYVDTETSKFGSDIRLIQVFQEGWDQVLLFNTDTTSVNIWVLLQPYHIVGHNLIYDFGCFKKDMAKGTFEMPVNWDDTFYGSRLKFPEWNTKNGYSLDAALTEVLGYDPYAREGLKKKQLQMSFERIKVKDKYVEGPDGLKPLTDDQLLYASIDVYKLPALYHAVKDVFTEFVYELDKLLVSTIMYDKKGLAVDKDKLQALEDKDTKLIADTTKKLNGLNVNSYMQVRKALGTVMSSDEVALQIIQHRPNGLKGLWIRAKMNNGKWPKALKEGIDNKTIEVETREFGNSTSVHHSMNLPKSPKVLVYYNESEYHHTPEKVQLAKMINEQRKASKRLNFVSRARSAMKEDEAGISRIQGTFSPHAINGRIQVDNENLSQYPRTMKSMWGHPQGNGRKLIYSDFAQVELRIICAALPEMNMYKSLKEGTDLHTFVGNNLELSEEDMAQLPDGINPRFIAKQCNFLLLYGGGVANFQQTVCKLGGVWFEADIAKKISDNWKNIFSDIKEWHIKNGKSKTNRDETVSGRPYKAGTITDLNNIRVSGTGSEIFKLWLWYLHKYVLTQYEDVYLTNRVHDSIIIDVPDDPDLYKEIAFKVALCSQKAWFEITKNAPLKDVPMPVEVAVGSNWEDIEYEKNLDFSYTLDDMYMYDKDLEEQLNEFRG